MSPLVNLITCFLLLPLSLSGADIEIQGRIVSADNVPMGGVNVLVMGTPNGTATNMEGYFTLSVPEGSIVLLFRYRKQKPLKHRVEIYGGYQYQINVVLANKVQTFNRSHATSDRLSLRAPVITGIVRDQEHRPLAGAIITQENNTFRASTDANGRFSLAVSSGENKLSVTYGDLKPLQLPVGLEENSRYYAEIILVEDVRKNPGQESIATLKKNP